MVSVFSSSIIDRTKKRTDYFFLKPGSVYLRLNGYEDEAQSGGEPMIRKFVVVLIAVFISLGTLFFS